MDIIKRINDPIEYNITELENMMLQGSNLAGGREADVSTIPLCRNPGGESISRVLDKNGQNHPCICSEINWKSGYDAEMDETAKFMARCGFMWSHDWPEYCEDENECSKVMGWKTNNYIKSLRQDGDPSIPRYIGSFSKCKERHNSKAHPGWPKKDMAQ
jgi:hypothetical protein